VSSSRRLEGHRAWEVKTPPTGNSLSKRSGPTACVTRRSHESRSVTNCPSGLSRALGRSGTGGALLGESLRKTDSRADPGRRIHLCGVDSVTTWLVHGSVNSGSPQENQGGARLGTAELGGGGGWGGGALPCCLLRGSRQERWRRVARYSGKRFSHRRKKVSTYEVRGKTRWRIPYGDARKDL